MGVIRILSAAMAEAEECVFCRISLKQEPNEILYEDEKVVAFRDIKPATNHHYLIIPKTHIKNPKSLDYEHLDMLTHMREVADEVLLQQGVSTDDVNKRFGYHWPPFNMIDHLHLHAIGNTASMGFIAKGIFMSGSPWFVSHEWLVKHLENMRE